MEPNPYTVGLFAGVILTGTVAPMNKLIPDHFFITCSFSEPEFLQYIEGGGMHLYSTDVIVPGHTLELREAYLESFIDSMADAFRWGFKMKQYQINRALGNAGDSIKPEAPGILSPVSIPRLRYLPGAKVTAATNLSLQPAQTQQHLIDTIVKLAPAAARMGSGLARYCIHQAFDTDQI